MRIGIHTWGSEGDLRPFIALAEGLADAGHEVRIAYCSAEGRDYSAQLQGVRFSHQRLGISRPQEELTRVAAEVFADRNPLRQFARVLEELLAPFLDVLLESALDLAKWADLLVCHPIAHPLEAAAEVEKKRLVCVYPGPMMATRVIAPPGFPNLGALNRVAWKVSLSLLSRKLVPSFGRIRARVGLPPIRRIEEQLGRSVVDLVAMSPTLFPRPRDWPAKVHVSGFLSRNAANSTRAIEPDTERFLAAGAAPIFITFGSMSAVEKEPREVLQVVESAVEKAGCRAILQSESTGAGSASVHRIGAAPHDLLFPRCAAIVHHGGVGTTQAAMRSGRPSVVVAHFADQFMWARLLAKLGVAPPHLARRGMDAIRLARAIQVATNDGAMRERAQVLGTAMRDEDGVRNAVELIERAGRGA